jgi:hypothetical protein
VPELVTLTKSERVEDVRYSARKLGNASGAGVVSDCRILTISETGLFVRVAQQRADVKWLKKECLPFWPQRNSVI